MTSAASAAQFPPDQLPEVAFLGRSNVGKSALLNALAATKGLARVSATPGRTQLISFFRVQPDGSRRALHLVDLPGYGYARAPESVRRSFERLVTSYLVGRESLRLCVFLVDARLPPQPSDALLYGWLSEHGLPFTLAATKVDKLGRGERAQRLASLERQFQAGALGFTPTSSTTGEGVRELWHAIREAADV